MPTGPGRERPARTLLEHLIRQRRQTLEEFAEYAETFAREHGEPGTLSERHLKRLMAGTGPDGTPVSRPRQVTARLLERIFNVDVDELLAPPQDNAVGTEENELRARLRASARIDSSTLALLAQQLETTRRLDRQFGAPMAHDEVCARIEQVSHLRDYSLTPEPRVKLAEHLAELCALAGWQALDMGQLTAAWLHHQRGESAAAESSNLEFRAHTSAERAFVLIDLGETASAVELLQTIRTTHATRSGHRMQAWLAAAHGEALAADQQRSASLKAFDEAAARLPDISSGASGAYVALDEVHLVRWRGHALARLHEPLANGVLMSALQDLDPTFARAETALRVDLATACTTAQDFAEADRQLSTAESLAASLGSVRQQRRAASQRRRMKAC